MPFITEELWHAMGEREYDLIVAKWPAPEAEENPIVAFIDGQAVDAKAEMHWIIGTITAIRAAKNDVGISPGQQLTAYLEDVTSNLWQRLSDAAGAFNRQGRIKILKSDGLPIGSALRIAVPGATLVVPLKGVIDLDAERARLEKAIAFAAKDRDALAARLANPAFAERAKPEAVEKARADHDARAAEAERLSAALARLG
ncbi:MAG: class I tRNA ligase family protein, partial [Sphingomicrobium sp.]